MPTPLHQLTDHGQSPWIDYVSRQFIRDGELADLVERGIVGITSNPTIFQSAIADGDAYDDQLREAARRVLRRALNERFGKRPLIEIQLVRL